jgi:plasmid stability protein
MATLNLKNFPDDLHEQAKSRAALEGITLKELVVQAVSGYLAGPITLDVQEVIVKKKESE